MRINKNLYPYLIYAGIAPYFISALFFIKDWDTLPILGSLETALSIYSLIIISFLGGSHWGIHLQLKNHWSFYLPLTSTGISLFIGFSYLLFSFHEFLLSFLISLAFLLWLDRKLLQKQIISHNYFKTRLTASFLTLLFILIIGFFTL